MKPVFPVKFPAPFDPRKKRAGYTLPEVLIVLTLIGVLLFGAGMLFAIGYVLHHFLAMVW